MKIQLISTMDGTALFFLICNDRGGDDLNEPLRVIVSEANQSFPLHCEERGEEAIQKNSIITFFAVLPAMTVEVKK